MEFLDHPDIFQAILDTTEEGVVVSDLKGKILFANTKAQYYFGGAFNINSLDERIKYYRFYKGDKVTPLDFNLSPLVRALSGETFRNYELFIAKTNQVEPQLFIFNGRPLFDTTKKLVGAVVTFHDVTEKRFAEQMAALSGRLEALMKQMPVGVIVAEADQTISFVNDKVRRMFSSTEDATSFFHEIITASLDGKKIVQKELSYLHREIGPRIYIVTATPVLDDKQRINSCILVTADRTEMKHEEETKIYLAQVQSLLTSTIHYDLVLDKIAESTIPFLADGCLVDIFEDNQIKRIVTKHSDPEIERLLILMSQKFPPHIDSPQPTPRVLRSGEAEMIKNIDQEMILKHTLNSEHADLIKKIGMKSHIAVPLISHGVTLGSINFFITSDRKLYDESDLQIAQSLGRNASVAIENARLFKNTQNALQLRNDFISIASHELNTPITSLSLQLRVLHEILKDFQIKDDQTKLMKNFLDKTNIQLQRLSNLVNDLLDIGRISGGKLSISRKEIDLTQLINEVLNQFQDEICKNEIPIELNMPARLMIYCDNDRVEQVIINLLSNAIKYGDNKTISISLIEEEQRALLKITDHGLGIAKEDQQRIFNRFERLTKTSEISGLGLGLYIAHQIINEHQGNIWVESEPGQGSTFFVGLPKI